MSELSLGDAIKAFLKRSKLGKGVQAAQIELAWEEIVGKTIARYTDKIELKGSTLFIHTSVAPLKSELLFQKQTLIQRVNQVLGEKVVNEIVIR